MASARGFPVQKPPSTIPIGLLRLANPLIKQNVLLRAQRLERVPLVSLGRKCACPTALAGGTITAWTRDEPGPFCGPWGYVAWAFLDGWCTNPGTSLGSCCERHGNYRGSRNFRLFLFSALSRF